MWQADIIRQELRDQVIVDVAIEETTIILRLGDGRRVLIQALGSLADSDLYVGVRIIR